MRWARATASRQLRRRTVAALVAGSVVVAGCGSMQGSASESSPGHRVAYSRPKTPPLPSPLCDLGRLRAGISMTVSSGGISVQNLGLRNGTNHACTLPTYWPSIRLGSNNPVRGPVGKALSLPDNLILTTFRASFAPYRKAEAFNLPSGAIASVIIISLAKGECQRYHFVKLYPSALALGASSIVRLARPIEICGTPFVLPYLSGQPGPAALAVAGRALRVKVQMLDKMLSHVPAGQP